MFPSTSSFKALAFIVNLLMLYACSGKKENNLSVYKALHESLVRSNAIITSETERIYTSLNDKLSDPLSHKKVALWYPKVMYAKQLSDEMYEYLRKLQIELLQEAGFTGNKKGVFDENNSEVVKRLLFKNGKGNELYKKLNAYKRKLLAIDPRVHKEFANSIQIVPGSLDTSTNGKGFIKTYFSDASVVSALAMLSQLQNTVKINEKRIVSFCYEQIIYHAVCIFYSPIFSQSSSYVKGGEEIEITAGLGYFKQPTEFDVSISGKKLNLNDDSPARYKFRASRKAGKHTITAKMEYVDDDGKKQIIEKDIVYTVAGDE